MFVALSISICVSELWATYMGELPIETGAFFWQVMAVLIILLGLFSEDTQRDKSVLAVMAMWFSWVMLTDLWPEYLPASITGIETMAFSFLVLWALARQYFYPSVELVGENIFIGFYQGTRAPLLSSLGALIGLPFSSMVVVAGETVLRASGNGKMVLNNRAALRFNDYVFVDTGFKATPESFTEIAKCVGKPTTTFGIFRTKCIKNCEPILELLGLKPRSWAHQMPSVFFYQVSGAKK